MKNMKYKLMSFLLSLMVFVVPIVSLAQLGPGDDPDLYQDFINSGGGSSNNAIAGASGTGACSVGQDPTIQSVLTFMSCILNRSIIPLLFGLATALFIWGVIRYMLNGDNESEREKGKQFMIWGIIALTVMVSVWGIVSLLGGSFGLDTNYIPEIKPS